jgi:hypothetical protein
MHSTTKIRKSPNHPGSVTAYSSCHQYNRVSFDVIKQTSNFSCKANGGNDSACLSQHKPTLSHAQYANVDDFLLTIFSSPMMHLLTLDPTTLFYWNISEMHNPHSQQRPSISEWASKIMGDTGPPST